MALCRLCMQPNAIYDLCDAFGVYNKLREIIEELFTLNIQPQANMPTMVCASCVQYVEEYYIFYNRVKQNQNILIARAHALMNNIIICVPAPGQFYFVQNYVPQPVIDNLCPPPTQYVYDNVPNSLEVVAGEETRNTNPEEELARTAEPVCNAYENIDEEDEDVFVVDEIDQTEETNDQINNQINDQIPVEIEIVDEINRNEPRKFHECEIEDHHERFLRIAENLKTECKIDDQEYRQLTQTPLRIIDEDGKCLFEIPLIRLITERYFKLQCELCTSQEQIYNMKQLNSHYTKHNRKGYVTCCGRRVYSQKKMAHHIASHLQRVAFTCQICNKHFQELSNVKLHMNSHSSDYEKRLRCDQCDRSFVYPSALNNHKAIHHLNTPKTFPCKICNKEFTTRAGVQRHMLVPHSEKIFTCDHCSKDFNTKSQLRLHMQIHMTDRVKYICEQCGITFSTKNSIAKHVKIHEVAEFRCPLCEYSSNRYFCLENHINRQHSDSRPYVCDYCDQRFKLKSILQSHINQHMEQVKL